MAEKAERLRTLKPRQSTPDGFIRYVRPQDFAKAIRKLDTSKPQVIYTETPPKNVQHYPKKIQSKKWPFHVTVRNTLGRRAQSARNEFAAELKEKNINDDEYNKSIDYINTVERLAEQSIKPVKGRNITEAVIFHTGPGRKATHRADGAHVIHSDNLNDMTDLTVVTTAYGSSTRYSTPQGKLVAPPPGSTVAHTGVTYHSSPTWVRKGGRTAVAVEFGEKSSKKKTLPVT